MDVHRSKGEPGWYPGTPFNLVSMVQFPVSARDYTGFDYIVLCIRFRIVSHFQHHDIVIL